MKIRALTNVYFIDRIPQGAYTELQLQERFVSKINKGDIFNKQPNGSFIRELDKPDNEWLFDLSDGWFEILE